MNFRKHKFWLKNKRMNLNLFSLSKRNLNQLHMLSELTFSKITLKNPTRKQNKWSKSLRIWNENGIINLKRLVKEPTKFLIKQSEEENLMNWVKHWETNKEIFNSYYKRRLRSREIFKTQNLKWKITKSIRFDKICNQSINNF